MKIAIIGVGNVGSALARRLANAGHKIFLGTRNVTSPKVQAILNENISAYSVKFAAQASEVIIFAIPSTAAKNIVDMIENFSGKIIIDAMNSIRVKPEPYSNTGTALLKWTNTPHVVKCFNSTGFENMIDPIYNEIGIDMFIAGDSEKGKEVAIQLAKDIGFENVYDFGGSDKFELIEQFALCWINLANMQGYGRNIAFKVLKR